MGDRFGNLNEDEQESVVIAVEVLQEQGPGLGRPLVDTIMGSRHANMTEMRPRGGIPRVLFAFDPRRMAILLIGGDKTDRWQARYQNTLAEILGMTQANISRIEHEEDLYLSTLRGYLAALGAELEVNAVFPDGKVALIPAKRS